MKLHQDFESLETLKTWKFYSLQQVTFWALVWYLHGGEEKLLGLDVSRHSFQGIYHQGIYGSICVTVEVLSFCS